MIKKFLSIEETSTTNLFCILTAIISLLGHLFVMCFLDGSMRDNIALILIVYLLITYLVGLKYPKASRNMLSCTVALTPFVIIISNSGNYAATAYTFFLTLIIAIAHFDMLQLLLHTISVIVPNMIGILLFPEPYLKIHNMTVWVYILCTYLAAAACALIITYRTHNLYERERQLHLSQLELTHLEQVEKKNDEHSKFIHDMHHYFTAIGSLAAEQNCSEILNILNDLNVEITKQQSIYYTSHRVINAILTEKFSLAEKQQLPMDIYVEPNIHLDNVSDGDIVIMLENLLVNAMEGVQKTDQTNRFLKVRIYHENEGRICVIKIENSFSSPLKYNKKGQLLSSKKQGLHGFGLKSVNQTAQKYGGYLQCTNENNVFTSILLLSVFSYKNC